MFPLSQHRNHMSLIPAGSPQLLDFASPLSGLGSVRCSFGEIPGPHCGGHGYGFNAHRAIQPWPDAWLNALAALIMGNVDFDGGRP